ncbi:MAG: hypothetical protein MR965_04290, partial [Lachnospiraceae bacterium]|nr:hypothetical protein [Lachnospiraceae bacterium]
IMNKYHVLFSACLIEEYGDIFEFPSEIHKHAIISMLYFIGRNSDDINQLEEVLLSDNQNSVRLKVFRWRDALCRHAGENVGINKTSG